MIGGTVGFILIAILVPLLLNEVGEIAPWLATRLLRWGALCLGSPEKAERYEEEWSADLERIPGKLTKLAYACSVVAWSVPSLRWQSHRAARRILPSLSSAQAGLHALLAESKREDITSVDVFAFAGLSAEDQTSSNVLAAWKKISQRGQVRIIATDEPAYLDKCKVLAAEGAEIRTAPGFATVRYCVLRGRDGDTVAFVYYQEDENSIPPSIRVENNEIGFMLGSNFNNSWRAASPL